MRKRILLILALLAVSFTSLRAQNVIDLIIAEALAVPDSTGIVDDYGQHLPGDGQHRRVLPDGRPLRSQEEHHPEG